MVRILAMLLLGGAVLPGLLGSTCVAPGMADSIGKACWMLAAAAVADTDSSWGRIAAGGVENVARASNGTAGEIGQDPAVAGRGGAGTDTWLLFLGVAVAVLTLLVGFLAVLVTISHLKSLGVYSEVQKNLDAESARIKGVIERELATLRHDVEESIAEVPRTNEMMLLGATASLRALDEGVRELTAIAAGETVGPRRRQKVLSRIRSWDRLIRRVSAELALFQKDPAAAGKALYEVRSFRSVGSIRTLSAFIALRNGDPRFEEIVRLAKVAINEIERAESWATAP